MYVVAPSLVSMFGSWPQLAHVKIRWFVVLALLETGSFAALWWLARISLTPEGEGARPGVGWGTTATAQLAGNAAAKVVPGGAAAGSVVQGRVLMTAGQPTGKVVSALTAVNLLTISVLLLLPVLTVPALIIGPPPARQLELGLGVSLILAVVIVAVGLTALSWRGAVSAVGHWLGRAAHLVRRSWT